MKTKLLYAIPYTLLYSRLVVAVLILILSFITVQPCIIVGLCVYAILSDIFDGIIARRLSISTAALRVMDSKIDTVFWFSCLFYLCIKRPQIFQHYILELLILVLSEILIIVSGFIRYQARVSFHTLLSKIWALCLMVFFIDAILSQSAALTFKVSFYYGLAVQTEILAILFLLKEHHTDVPSVLHAIKLRQGKSIRRHKLFNG